MLPPAQIEPFGVHKPFPLGHSQLKLMLLCPAGRRPAKSKNVTYQGLRWHRAKSEHFWGKVTYQDTRWPCFVREIPREARILYVGKLRSTMQKDSRQRPQCSELTHLPALTHQVTHSQSDLTITTYYSYTTSPLQAPPVPYHLPPITALL